ncbi:hypothetical protein AACH06_24740 [Ideonella sp. DXS29W]|uniref:Uncharacterized protein n=1 Tax=Ideonella lacteola TaxID=2984193 RepID=A0ABU9BVQ4_9BURK
MTASFNRPSLPAGSTLTSSQAGRIKTVVVSIALISWATPLAALMLVAPAWRVGAAIALGICAACLLATVALSWMLYCPWCGERLFFVSSIWNSPSGSQIARQFVPHDILMHHRFTCPHCHARFSLRRE